MRKHILLAIIILSTTIISCTKNTDETDKACGPRACTLEFLSITVKFVDKLGNVVTVQDYKAINDRTGMVIKYAGPSSDTQAPRYYTVANDSDLKEFSDEGDEVTVSGTSPVNGQVKTAKFKIAGGCACHIHKIAGPTEIAFD